MLRKIRQSGGMLLAFFIVGCVIFKPLKIAVPSELYGVERMKVGGGEKSVLFDFGPFHVFDIGESTGRVLYSDFKSSYYEIKSFEFKLNDPLGNVWECWCEYPQRSLFDERIRSTFQDDRNPAILWNLVDSTLTLDQDILTIRPYFKTVEKRRIGSTLMGYTFSSSDSVRAMVDISSARSEAIWINPNVKTNSALAIAATSSAFILKHRQLHYNQKIDDQSPGSDFGM